MIARYESSAQCDAELDKLKSYWDNLLSVFTLESNDEKLNRMVNIWNPYQCMVTFNMSRSASYYESGIGRGMGFRYPKEQERGLLISLQLNLRTAVRIISINRLQSKVTMKSEVDLMMTHCG